MPTIHIDAGYSEILTPTSVLQDHVLTIENAGRTCYQSERGDINHASADTFIKMLMKRNHMSVLEHSSMVVRFSNCSRGFTHELVRHRLCSFSQESTRYVDESNLNIVLPAHRDLNEKIQCSHEAGNGWCHNFSPKEFAGIIESYYKGLLEKGWAPEDARQFLPIGTVSQIICSANFRQWRHVFKMRCDKHAHWEIRKVMCELLDKVIILLPGVFGDFKLQCEKYKGLNWYKPEYEA